jgi:hypothetical protein
VRLSRKTPFQETLPAYNTGNHGALLIENLAAPLFLPRLGFVRFAAGNESSLSGVAHFFCGGKNNGVVARNVSCNAA